MPYLKQKYLSKKDIIGAVITGITLLYLTDVFLNNKISDYIGSIIKPEKKIETHFNNSEREKILLTDNFHTETDKRQTLNPHENIKPKKRVTSIFKAPKCVGRVIAYNDLTLQDVVISETQSVQLSDRLEAESLEVRIDKTMVDGRYSAKSYPKYTNLKKDEPESFSLIQKGKEVYKKVKDKFRKENIKRYHGTHLSLKEQAEEIGRVYGLPMQSIGSSKPKESVKISLRRKAKGPRITKVLAYGN